jgi:predicted glycoside hydrolase/deacetylase ChbG (UPF0249 family)
MTIVALRNEAPPKAREVPSLASGALIVNADDWGRDRQTTDRTLECFARSSVSSVSAMVYMDDSLRAAELAREQGVDAGLHLNFTSAFDGNGCPSRLLEHQGRVSRYLLRHRLAQVMFHPCLRNSFAYVVQHQIDEYHRRYGVPPERLDGHHHMHLCANVVFDHLLPAGVIVRRNFSFQPGEKSAANRRYRRWLDGRLARRFLLTDYLFNLQPMEDATRLDRIFSLARGSVVELETHPTIPAEYSFLTNGELLRRTGGAPIVAGFALPQDQN